MFDCAFDNWVFFDKQDERRFQIVHAFYQSEEVYVNQLEFVELNYEIPLFKHLSSALDDKKLILKEAKLKLIFSTFSEIRKLKKSFFSNLLQQVNAFPCLLSIGDLIKSNVCFMFFVYYSWIY